MLIIIYWNIYTLLCFVCSYCVLTDKCSSGSSVQVLSSTQISIFISHSDPHLSSAVSHPSIRVSARVCVC